MGLASKLASAGAAPAGACVRGLHHSPPGVRGTFITGVTCRCAARQHCVRLPTLGRCPVAFFDVLRGAWSGPDTCVPHRPNRCSCPVSRSIHLAAPPYLSVLDSAGKSNVRCSMRVTGCPSLIRSQPGAVSSAVSRTYVQSSPEQSARLPCFWSLDPSRRLRLRSQLPSGPRCRRGRCTLWDAASTPLKHRRCNFKEAAVEGSSNLPARVVLAALHSNQRPARIGPAMVPVKTNIVKNRN